MVQIFLSRQLWYSHTLKQHRNFGRAFTWVKFVAFTFRFYNKEFRRIYKFITVLHVEGLTHTSVSHRDIDLSTEWSQIFRKIPCDLVVWSWLITHAQHEQGNLKSGIMVLVYAWIFRFNSLCVIYIYLSVSTYTIYVFRLCYGKTANLCFSSNWELHRTVK